MTKIKLEVGKTYKNRFGYHVKILRKEIGYPRFIGLIIEQKEEWRYYPNGTFFKSGIHAKNDLVEHAKNDLVEEVTEEVPKADNIKVDHKKLQIRSSEW